MTTLINDSNVTVNLQNFLSNKKTHHGDFINQIEALQYLNKNKKDIDIVTYYLSKILVFKNVSILEIDSNGQYYYDINIDKTCDIIGDINVVSNSNLKFKISYIIENDSNKIVLEYINDFLFVLVAAYYSKLKIRLTFLEKPPLYDELKINTKCYFLHQEDRFLLSSNIVESKYIKYINGLCEKVAIIEIPIDLPKILCNKRIHYSDFTTEYEALQF